MKFIRLSALAIGLALVVPLRAHATPILVGSGDLTGSRSTPTNVVADDGWTAPNGGFKIAWDITFTSGTWNYKYTFTDTNGATLSPDLSHFLLEVSPTITAANVDSLIFNTNFTLVDPKTWTADPLSPGNTSPGGNNANPNLPVDIYAIKLDTGSDVVNGMYTFQSVRAPIWGDFYGKDGKHSGILAVAWNSGIGTDPTSTTTDFSAWVPVPDTVAGSGTASLPSTVSLFFVGLASLAWFRRRE